MNVFTNTLHVVGLIQVVLPYLDVQDGGHTPVCTTHIVQLLRSGIDKGQKQILTVPAIIACVHSLVWLIGIP